MRCWAGGTGSPAALEGTADGGRSWSLVTASSQGSFDEGSVSCLSVSACVATADNGLWVPADDGGLAG